MKSKIIIETINSNQIEIQNHGKLDSDTLKKINYKFRLDWNYYSNRMEGGTLTRDETRSVMVGNIDVHGKPIKDIIEMRGHDATVLDILSMGKGELRISEKRIKAIHVAIMQEDNPDKKAEIGQWKSAPNEIINYRGEKISFTSPADVKNAIHKLLDETNAQLDNFFAGKKSLHPLEIASKFHLDFVSIHPFYDGNGRMSRILANLLLVSCGFPPVIIKDGHKRTYYQLLADIQVYNGDSDLFQNFLGERLLESQQIVLDAIAGKSIEEEDDLDKEIILWKQEIHKEDAQVQPRSDEKIVQVYLESLRPLFQAYIEKTKQFDDLFFEKYIANSLGAKLHRVNSLEFFDHWASTKTPMRSGKKILKGISELAKKVADVSTFENTYKDKESLESNEMTLHIDFKGFRNNGSDSFDESIHIHVKFEQYYYVITNDTDESYSLLKKLYSEKLTPSEIDSFVKESVRETFENMKSRVKKQSGKDE